MVLKDRIESDFKTALKSRDAVRLSCLRMIKAAIVNKEMEAADSARGGSASGGKKLDDTGVIAVLNLLARRAQEAIEQFGKGGRNDLVEKEKAELVIIKSYLPEALSESELAKIVDEAIAEAAALGPKDMGKVMKVLMPKVAGRADGKAVSALVQEKLKVKS